MQVKVSTIISASPAQVFEMVKTKTLFFHVIYPMASFRIISPKEENDNWKEGETYTGWSFLFQVIPFGKERYTSKK